MRLLSKLQKTLQFSKTLQEFIGELESFLYVDGGFLIRLPNQNYNLQQAKDNASKREQQLLDTYGNKEFAKEDAAKTLSISASGAYKLLVRMSEKGLLNTRKAGKQSVY